VTHILLVEDNPIDARLVQHALGGFKDWPTRITLVDDGQKALWYLRSLEEGRVAESPALILLDVNLPKYDGLQVLEGFRNSPVAWYMPIFLFSSAPVEDIAALAESRQLSADGYFEKPHCLQGFKEVAAKIRAYHGNLASAVPAVAIAVEFSGHASKSIY
jgi:chemotaxis family two-component system response regulator Rcp1